MVDDFSNSQITINCNKSCELLNSVKYNYGKLTDSQSCCSFQKTSNRLAICTEKSLIIINLNLNWPKILDSVTPAKLRRNYEKITAQKTPLPSEFTKSSFQIDAWIQDLVENKNNFLSINLISSTWKSKAVEGVYKDFFKIEENFKRKPFHRQIKDLVDSNTNGNNSISVVETTKTSELSSLDAHIKIIESNYDQYSRHKHLIEQHNIYDANFYDYLSFLNPINNQNQHSTTVTPTNFNLPLNYFNCGFKYCKWNKNHSFELICVINACNQLLILNCTHLNKAITPINQEQSAFEEGQNLNDPITYNKVFDSKSGSTIINLTELWLYKYRPNLLKPSEKSKTVNDYYNRILQLMPIHLAWSETFQTSDHKTSELLFVTLKSNEITGYLITENSGNQIGVELVCVLPMPVLDENIFDDDEACVPNLLDFISTDIQPDSNRILCTEFWNKDSKIGILAIGLQNGNIFLASLNLQDLKSDRKKSLPRYYKVRGILDTGGIESIKMYKIVQNTKQLKILVVAKHESCLVFSIVDYNYETDQFWQDENNCPKFYNDRDSQKEINSQKNFLIQSHYRLIKIKLVNKKLLGLDEFIFEFWLIFENTYIKNLNVRVSLKKSKEFYVTGKFYLEEAKLINDSAQLRFECGKNDNSIDSQFKMTRAMFFSNDDSLIFQINDYSKLEFVQRKITQLEVNLYCVKPQEEIILSLLPSSNQVIEQVALESLELKKLYSKGITELTDIIWSFKRNLYLKIDFFDFKVFQHLHEHIKHANKLIDMFELVNDCIGFKIFIKRLRILTFYLANYFEMVASFDYLNKPISKLEEDLMDEENDESEIAEADESKIEPSLSEKSKDCSIIKSPFYYRSVFKEYTLCIFRSYALKLVYHAFNIGFKNLTNKERLILLLIGDFSIKKNFLADEKHKQILSWLDENFINIDNAAKITDKSNSSVNLITLCKQIKCDLCGKSLRIDLSKESNSVECEMGHVMSRCQKSLLPLNSLNFKTCTNCYCTWNIFDPTDYPNLDQLYSTQNFCILCK